MPPSSATIRKTQSSSSASTSRSKGETYGYTTIYPEFAAHARTDRDQRAEAAFQGQVDESKEHAGLFHTAAKILGMLSPIEHHHAERYGVALKALEGVARLA